MGFSKWYSSKPNRLYGYTTSWKMVLKNCRSLPFSWNWFGPLYCHRKIVCSETQTLNSKSSTSIWCKQTKYSWHSKPISNQYWWRIQTTPWIGNRKTIDELYNRFVDITNKTTEEVVGFHRNRNTTVRTTLPAKKKSAYYLYVIQ